MSFKAFFLSLTIVAMLVFSAFGTTPVYADDGVTTDTSAPATSTEESTTPDAVDATAQPEDTAVATEATVQPEDTAVSTEATAQPEDTAVATEATALPEDTAVATDEAIVPDAVSTEAPPVDDSPALPDNTTITVVNSDGEAQPLATQESADAIASAYDPIWCPEGQSPTPGANGCTDSFGSFDELLSFLQANEGDAAYQQAGTIYIQQGQYLGGESSIDFNNYNFQNLNNYNLTLQGGWDTNADPNVDPVYTNTQFDVPITIGSSLNPWTGSLTFNNIWISGVTDQTGLTAYSENNITLSDVQVTDSQTGAELNAGGNVLVNNSNFNNNNDAGAIIKAGGNVDVKNSHFDGNGGFAHPGYGLQIESGGNVSLADTSASFNERYGADINAGGNVTVTNSVFSGNVEYRYYCETCSNRFAIGGYGLQVVSVGNIQLDGITADNNYFFGANLAGANVQVSNASFSNNGTGRTEESQGYGLQVLNTNQVTLANVTANNNERFGANIQATGAVKISSSFFNGNTSYTYSDADGKQYHGYGIQVVSDSEISLINVEATGNDLFGAHIEGSDVAIDTANFSNNGSGSGQFLTGKGLEVISANTVSLAAVTANNNQLFGANIVADGLVAIEQSYFNGQIAFTYFYGTNKISSRDGGYGLKVVTNGNIALEQVTTNGNYLYGTYLEGKNISISDSFFTANGSGVVTQPVGYGLKVVSSGSVDLTNINDENSVGNQLFGADITAAKDVSIVNAFFSNTQSVTVTPDSVTFYGYGLNVVTQGDIFLNYVTANFNNLWGGSLTGNDVSVYNSQFNNNVSDSITFIDDTGLIVNASGDVDIFKSEAKENRLIGATITAAGDVFVTDSVFSDNQGFTCSLNWCPEGSITYYGYGLQVVTPGLIQLSGVTANGNNLFGASLQGAGVSVTDSTFNNNAMGNGLTINATDLVTLTNVTALNNGGNGVEVTGVCSQVVQVDGGTFSNNALYGIKVVNSTLTVDGTQIFANNGSGNIFTDTSTCAVVTPTNTTDTGITSSSNTTTTVTSSSTTTNTKVGSSNGKHKNKKHHKNFVGKHARVIK